MESIRKNFNVPNTVTGLRALGLPFALSAFCHGEYGRAFILFILLAATDKLDGFLARRLKQVTAFGKVFDPVLDKTLTVSFLLVLLIIPGPIDFRWIPAQEVLFVLYIIAEAGLIISRINRFKEPLGFQRDDGATKVSKIKMPVICMAIGFMLLGFAIGSAWPHVVGEIFFGLSVLLAGFAFAARFVRVSRAFRSVRASLTNRFAIMCWDRIC